MRAVTFEQFASRKDDRNIRLIDVREPDEFAEVHVVDAELHPLSRIRKGDLPEPDDREVYVICRSGGRSAVACKAFEGAGFDECTNILDGTIGAIEAGDEFVERG